MRRWRSKRGSARRGLVRRRRSYPLYVLSPPFNSASATSTRVRPRASNTEVSRVRSTTAHVDPSHGRLFRRSFRASRYGWTLRMWASSLSRRTVQEHTSQVVTGLLGAVPFGCLVPPGSILRTADLSVRRSSGWTFRTCSLNRLWSMGSLQAQHITFGSCVVFLSARPWPGAPGAFFGGREPAPFLPASRGGLPIPCV